MPGEDEPVPAGESRVRRIARRLQFRWSRTRPWMARLRRNGPSARVVGWATVLSLGVAVVFGVLSLVEDEEDRGEKDEFSVLELSAGQSRPTKTTKVDEATGGRYVSEEEATTLYVYLSNNTDDLLVFRGIKVKTKRFIEVSDCVLGVGGPVQITAGYDIDLPKQGKSANKSILYQLRPRQAEGISITLGTEAEEDGIYELEIFLLGGSEYRKVGEVIAFSYPGLEKLYPRDLATLPLHDFPNASCVRRLDRTLTDFIAQHDSVPKEVRTLQKGVHMTAEELG
ncbi:hypothetical protein GCM10018787_51670 [Streptomyces thermodiastaticus]|nr:hypothetical protein GCM10018787_51670 [Streptomyces thermodiastaticus]